MRIETILATRSGRPACQQRHSLVYRRHRVDQKLAGRAGFDNVAAEHQMLHVGIGDQDALGSGEAALLANVGKVLSMLAINLSRL